MLPGSKQGVRYGWKSPDTGSGQRGMFMFSELYFHFGDRVATKFHCTDDNVIMEAVAWVNITERPPTRTQS